MGGEEGVGGGGWGGEGGGGGEKISLDIPCELSAIYWVDIHMKCQALFFSENKKNKIRISSTAVVNKGEDFCFSL